MNERIQEIAEQAGYTPIPGFDFANSLEEVFITKFAELIVREMLHTCEDHPAWTGRMIGEEIKQHFGVEE